MTTKSLLKPQPSGKYAQVVPLPTPPKAPDAMQQLPYITTAYSILDTYFHRRPDVFVGGDGYLCSDTRNRSRWVRPDCVVAFGVDPDAILARNGYVISEIGKPKLSWRPRRRRAPSPRINARLRWRHGRLPRPW